jgi:lipoic acid synthetase
VGLSLLPLLSCVFRLLRDPRAGYKQSLSVLRHAKYVRPDLVTKSSIMLGVGETDDEILQTMKGAQTEIRSANTAILWCL